MKVRPVAILCPDVGYNPEIITFIRNSLDKYLDLLYLIGVIPKFLIYKDTPKGYPGPLYIKIISDWGYDVDVDIVTTTSKDVLYYNAEDVLVFWNGSNIIKKDFGVFENRGLTPKVVILKGR
jgi:hypothetical protein